MTPLRQQMIRQMDLKNLSPHTQRAYLAAVTGLARHYTMQIQMCWELAQRWYTGRLEREWERPDEEKTKEIFEKVGLKGPFWSL